MEKPKEVYLAYVNQNPSPNNGKLALIFENTSDYNELYRFINEKSLSQIDNATIEIEEMDDNSYFLKIEINDYRFNPFEIPINSITKNELIRYEKENKSLKLKIKSSERLKFEVTYAHFDLILNFISPNPAGFADEGKNN